ncbi:hypothetical protein pdam_00016635 [Pocillopora damicornis]|uniref:Uncharacterized protein n=1 Tax=Pocillopora damicornis TaxID=46731 RepID=A0A3M6TFK4_POCDA|nr:hypothetical protein pdam_00016635 [Pocillopora damicornis]
MGWNENGCLDSGKTCENVRNDEDEGSWDDNESDEEEDGSTKEFLKYPLKSVGASKSGNATLLII